MIDLALLLVGIVLAAGLVDWARARRRRKRRGLAPRSTDFRWR